MVCTLSNGYVYHDTSLIEINNVVDDELLFIAPSK